MRLVRQTKLASWGIEPGSLDPDMFRSKFNQVFILFLNQISERLTQKVVKVFNVLNNSNAFLGAVLPCLVPTLGFSKSDQILSGSCKTQKVQQP